MMSLATLATAPNIVYLVIDDLGWADHTLHDLGADIPTPNLRALRDDGVLFDNLYVQPVCSPTRSALMSGRFPFRDGMQHMDTIMAYSTAAIPLDTPTIAEMLTEQAGYEAHAIGKWHLGYASWANVPTSRGFLTHTGYLQAQTDYWNKTFGLTNAIFARGNASEGFDFWRCRQRAQPACTPFREAVGTYSLDIYMTAAAGLIGEHAARRAAGTAKPLFLYLAHQTVHNPLEARSLDERCATRDPGRKVFCSMVVEMDDSVGKLVGMLKDAHLWENTLLAMTTDNGASTESRTRNLLTPC